MVLGKIMQKKKKTIRPAANKRGGKKISRRKRVSSVKDLLTGVSDIDTIYKIANRVQLNREPATFTIKEEDAPVVENIIKDLEFPYKRKKAKKSLIEYSVQPPPVRDRGEGSEDVEELSDEILEEGQILF